MARPPDPIVLTEIFKVCTGCSRNLDTGFFSLDSTKSDNLSTRCKDCRRRKSETVDKNLQIKANLQKLRRSAKSAGIIMCASCNKVMEPGDFYERETRCKSCCIKRSSDFARHSKRGWSVDAYEASYELQGGKCAICNIFHEKLSGDHCHKTGITRELLCSSCNLAIGMMKENPEYLRAAAAYCEKYDPESPLTQIAPHPDPARYLNTGK